MQSGDRIYAIRFSLYKYAEQFNMVIWGKEETVIDCWSHDRVERHKRFMACMFRRQRSLLAWAISRRGAGHDVELHDVIAEYARKKFRYFKWGYHVEFLTDVDAPKRLRKPETLLKYRIAAAKKRAAREPLFEDWAFEKEMEKPHMNIEHATK